MKVPHGASCFLCQSATVEGITGLPKGMHYVVAPYGAATSTKTYPGFDGYSGDGQVTKGKVGVDAKWLPDADTIVDATLNPDFSQIESDTAQITRQRAVRAVLSGEAPVLPRARGPAADADPGRVHADDHVAVLGRRA